MEWQDISSAPRDGTAVWCKRVYNGCVIAEGWAVWGVNSADSPMRQFADGGLYAPIPPDHEYADEPKWLKPDRRYSFPAPTHWTPSPPTE